MKSSAPMAGLAGFLDTHKFKRPFARNRSRHRPIDIGACRPEMPKTLWRRQHFNPDTIGLKPRAGKWRQAANMAIQIDRMSREIQPRFRLVDFLGIGDTVSRLAQSASIDFLPPKRQCLRRPIAPACHAGFAPYHHRQWQAFFQQQSPVSNPACICIMATPVCLSPAIMAR